MPDTDPSSAELIERAAGLVPLLRENAPKAEQLRRLTDETVQAVEEAGLFRLFRPVKRGGIATDAATLAKVMTTIASGCASTTWVMSIYSAVAQLAELLSEQVLAEIYADPHPRIAGVFGKTGAVVEPVDGGYRVRGGGRWPFNSGCAHASWDLLLLLVEEADGSQWPAFAAVPMADLTICDDWDVMGAMGTGSSAVACEALFIPAHRVARVPKDMRAVFNPETAGATSVALPLGMARHALEAFLALAPSAGIANLGYKRLADAPAAQAAVARAAVDIKLIEGFQSWVLGLRGASPDPGDAAILALGPVRAFELARGIIESLFALAPSTQVHRSGALQRLLRDAHVFQHQHAASPFINFELQGRRFLAA